MDQGLWCGVRCPDLKAFELGELRQVRCASISELRVREADAFEVGQVIAELFQALIVDAAAAMADLDELPEVLELRIRLARDLRAHERERFEVLQARELLHACIGELAIVGKAQRLEVRELREVRHPIVVEFRGDDVQRLQRGDVADMLEERRVIRIVLPLIMRTRVRHLQINQFQALPVFRLLYLTFRGFDGADDGFNMGIKGKSRASQEQKRGQGE